MKIHLSTIRCRYCKHANPADAKFCGACGGELHLPPHLTSCLHCGAVNSANATVCIWCHRSFPEREAGALVPSSPAARVSRSSPRRVIAGAVVLAAIGVLGYYGYRQVSPGDVPPPGSTSSEAASGAKAADDSSSASADPLATPARAAVNPPRAGREPVESQEGKAPAAITRSQTGNLIRPGEDPSRQEACTEGLAALGLCAAKPEAAKAGGQEPSRAAACTAEAAALGMCARTTQRGE
jgi:hypothetical protein